jgi:hypothetical protein
MKQLIENLWLDNLDGDLFRFISSIDDIDSFILCWNRSGTPGLTRMMMDSNNLLLIGFLSHIELGVAVSLLDTHTHLTSA